MSKHSLTKSFLLIFLFVISCARANAETEMADVMRSNGKIYVVIVVIATIFAGIFAYLVYLDRKIGKLEKDNK